MCSIALPTIVAFTLIVGIPTITAIVTFFARKNARTVVKVSPEGLRVEKHTGWSVETKRVDAMDIVDIDPVTPQGTLESMPESAATEICRPPAAMDPKKGIVVKSRKNLIAVGEGLPAAELHYLASVMRKALTGSEPRG
jgi:hypothetical protein